MSQKLERRMNHDSLSIFKSKTASRSYYELSQSLVSRFISRILYVIQTVKTLQCHSVFFVATPMIKSEFHSKTPMLSNSQCWMSQFVVCCIVWSVGRSQLHPSETRNHLEFSLNLQSGLIKLKQAPVK